MTKVRGERVSVSDGPALYPVSALFLRGMQPFAENVDPAISLGLNLGSNNLNGARSSLYSLITFKFKINGLFYRDPVCI